MRNVKIYVRTKLKGLDFSPVFVSFMIATLNAGTLPRPRESAGDRQLEVHPG